MSEELEDVFGEDLAQNIRQQTAKKRQERNEVTEEQIAQICYVSVNENKFGEGEPQFQYTTENKTTHTVLLMQVPEINNGTVWEYLDEPWEGAASLPLEYLGDWMNVTFPDKNDVKKIDSGDWCVVIGKINTYEKNDGTEGESVLARGIATLEEAKEYSQQGLEDEGFPAPDDDDLAEMEPEPEPEEEPEEEEEKEDASSKGGMFGGGSSSSNDDDDEEEESSSGSSGGLGGLMDEAAEDDDDEEEEEDDPVPYEDVAELVETLGDKEEAVWEVTEGDDRLDRLVEVVCNKLDLTNEDGVEKVVLDVIDGNSEEEEEDDEITDTLF